MRTPYRRIRFGHGARRGCHRLPGRPGFYGRRPACEALREPSPVSGARLWV